MQLQRQRCFTSFTVEQKRCLHHTRNLRLYCQSAARQSPADFDQSMCRRTLLMGLSAGLTVAQALSIVPEAAAAVFPAPPPGYRRHVDKLDGYTFVYPETWIPVTTSGNDVFYRNPFNLNENVFVNITSPSSSKFASVSDLGSPPAAGARLKDQLLEEFMSTRLGVRREADIKDTAQRTGSDGQMYYDVQVEVKSYASRNQLAVSQAEVDAGIELEWDRRCLTVLGVANRRLYELRLQTSEDTYTRDAAALKTILDSFQCYTVSSA